VGLNPLTATRPPTNTSEMGKKKNIRYVCPIISKKINIPGSHIIMLYDISSNAQDDIFDCKVYSFELFPLLYFNMMLYCKDSKTRFDKGHNSVGF
jgi:hypothetical protein